MSTRKRVIFSFVTYFLLHSQGVIAQGRTVGEAEHGVCAYPTPITDVEGVNWYADRQSSVVDDAKRKLHMAKLKPLHDFLGVVAKEVDASATAGKAAPNLACATANLTNWAKSKALLAPPKWSPALAEQTIAVVGLNFIAIKLRGASIRLEPEIEVWIRSATRVITDTYARNDVRQNLYVWSGVAAASSDLLLPDQRFRAYHTRVWQAAIAQIGQDGYVQSELARAGRSLVYHNFLRSALSALSLIRSKLGMPPNSADNGAMLRLSSVINANICSAQNMEVITGAKQERLDRWNVALGENFSKSFLDENWSRCAGVFKEFFAATYGGRFDLTVVAIEKLHGGGGYSDPRFR